MTASIYTTWAYRRPSHTVALFLAGALAGLVVGQFVRSAWVTEAEAPMPSPHTQDGGTVCLPGAAGATWCPSSTTGTTWVDDARVTSMSAIHINVVRGPSPADVVARSPGRGFRVAAPRGSSFEYSFEP